MKKIFTIFAIMLSGSVASAVEDGLTNVATDLTTTINNIYIFILAALGVAFAWGVLKFVFKSGTDQEEGKSMMIWSLVAITILASVYGIVTIFQQTVGVKESDNKSNIFPEINDATVPSSS